MAEVQRGPKTKRYIVWKAGALLKNFKQYDELLHIMKDLQSEVYKYNILDTENKEWLLIKDK